MLRCMICRPQCFTLAPGSTNGRYYGPGPQFSQEAYFMQVSLIFLLQGRGATAPLTSPSITGLPDPHPHLWKSSL